MDATLTLISGASENHAKSLVQFLASVERSGHTGPLVVYDLGLQAETFQHIQQRFRNPTIVYKTFDYSKYPDYYKIEVEAGQYAWKPAILWEECQVATTDLLLWCDAGNVLRGSLADLIAIIGNQGIYSPISAGTVRQWTHPGMLAYMKVAEGDAMLSKSPRNGAILGFDVRKQEVQDLLKTFADLAAVRDCLAPPGSDRSNHRQDQALFTLLYYRYTGGAGLASQQISLLIHQDVD